MDFCFEDMALISSGIKLLYSPFITVTLQDTKGYLLSENVTSKGNFVV